MFAAGATAPQAAKALGVSRATAYRWWTEHRAEQAASAPADSSPPGPVPDPAGLAEQEWTEQPAMAPRQAEKTVRRPPPPALVRPPRWARASLAPHLGNWCSACRGATWWTPVGPIAGGWACVGCCPPAAGAPVRTVET
jgi:hypothetical protein